MYEDRIVQKIVIARGRTVNHTIDSLARLPRFGVVEVQQPCREKDAAAGPRSPPSWRITGMLNVDSRTGPTTSAGLPPRLRPPLRWP